jgi:putative nucleotide-binding protein containing TIR-like domain
MPYYHVQIKRKSVGPPYELYDLNISDLSATKEGIIIPYLNKEEFVFNGYCLDRDKVECIVIKESDCSLDIDPEDPFERGFEDIKNISNQIFWECISQLNNTPNTPQAPMDKSKVFIVHGHDDAAKEKVARFIEKLGFEAIILHEQASSGNTIIEKIEEYSNVGFAIVLYTPCDEGGPKGKKDQVKSRARQNVVFEHGYLMGKIGRKNVCPLVKGDLETPTDISGIVYTPMDEGDGWKSKVADEMEACGYEVDRNKMKR